MYSGPQLDWDPDIVAAMDDDFDYSDPGNELEDDFVLRANDGEVVTAQPAVYIEEEEEEEREDSRCALGLHCVCTQQCTACTHSTVCIGYCTMSVENECCVWYVSNIVPLPLSPHPPTHLVGEMFPLKMIVVRHSVTRWGAEMVSSHSLQSTRSLHQLFRAMKVCSSQEGYVVLAASGPLFSN